MLKNPQTLRSYPKAQIRQGADVVSAPTRRRYDGPGWRDPFPHMDRPPARSDAGNMRDNVLSFFLSSARRE